MPLSQCCQINLQLWRVHYVRLFTSAFHECFCSGRNPWRVLFFRQTAPRAGLGFFRLVIDGKSLQTLIQIEKSKNTAFVSAESLLQMSCLHIFKLKINTPLHIKKECFLSICCGKVMDFLISSSSSRSWLGRSGARALVTAAPCLGGIGHAPTWGFVAFIFKAVSEVFVLVVCNVPCRGCFFLPGSSSKSSRITLGRNEA